MQDVLPTEAADLELTALDAQQIEPGVWRVPLPLPFGAHTVNAYLVRGARFGDGWLLVDCPLATSLAENALQRALVQAGISSADIAAILLTHAHPDHLGAVGEWQRRCGAPVYLHADEANDLMPLWQDFSNRAFLDAGRALVAHGMPADEAQALVTRAVQVRSLLVPPTEPSLLQHGQRLQLAGATYTIHSTPGHSDGHICLLRDDGLLLAGDAILPGLRPTVGWYPWSRLDPLADQFATLAALEDLPARRVLSGHGQPFTNLRERAGVLCGSYTRELAVISRLLADAPDGLTAYALTHTLYAARWHTIESRLIAMAETVARLEHLTTIGRAERAADPDGTLIYHRAQESSQPKLNAS